MLFLRPLLAIVISLSAAAGAGSAVFNPSVRLAQSATGSAPSTICPAISPPICGEYQELVSWTTPEGCLAVECRLVLPPGQEGIEDIRCLEDNKRSIAEFERSPMKRLEDTIRRLQNEKVEIGADILNGIEQLRGLIIQVKESTTCTQVTGIHVYEFYRELEQKVLVHERSFSDRWCIKDTLRGVNDFERSTLREIDRKIKQLERQKITPPDRILAAIQTMRDIITRAKQATTCRDASELSQELYGVHNEIKEQILILDFLVQAPRKIKQMQREIRNTNRQWVRAVRLARASKADPGDLIARGEAILSDLQAILDEFKAAVASGDFERVQAVIERGQEAEAKRDDLFEIIQTLQAIANAPREIRLIHNRLKSLRYLSSQLARNNDVTALNSCINTLVLSHEAAKVVAAARPINVENLIDAFERVTDDLSKCEDLLEDLQGKKGVFEDVFGGIKSEPPGAAVQ